MTLPQYTYLYGFTKEQINSLADIPYKRALILKVGDMVESLPNDSPIDRPTNKQFMVIKIHNTDVYYRDGYATHYPKFELVKSAMDTRCSQEPTTKLITKENKMTIQQLLQTLFGAEKPATDYDRRPALLVVAYNRNGSEMGTATADNVEAVKAKVADTPELWGCKVLTYTLDQEVYVKVPVKTTKAEIAKSDKE